MALTQYRTKRDLKKSPEPKGGKPGPKELRFVVQKHKARQLHYDFRLEMEGVLKSWAVPKGPTLDPDVKRLAMMVEDHPYDYRDFEGIIPGGYGAGTVIVWDEGAYEPYGFEGDKKAQDKYLRSGLKKGKIHFVLHGKKLKGEFALVKGHGRGENGWLLIKVKDKFASADDVLKKDKSVVSKKTLEQIEKTSNTIYDSKTHERKVIKASSNARKSAVKKKREATSKIPASKKAANSKLKTGKTKSIGRRASFPATISPMLATLVNEPFDTPGWLYEVKWDGYRAIAFSKNNKIELRSRNNKSFKEKYYPVTEALKEMKIQAVLDGEIVVLDKNGISNFSALQNWRSESDGELYYYIFDLLWLEGRDLTNEQFTFRRKLLEPLIPQEGILRLSQAFDEPGTKFFDVAKKIGLEGIIAKKKDSIYNPGFRSSDWLKIKANTRQEMVIGGFTKNVGSSKSFSSLLLGVFENGKLRYTGKVGTGFNDKHQLEILKLLKPYVIKSSPFKEMPDVNKPSRFRPNPPHATAVWVKPQVVCEVSFTEMTNDGVMRHPSFEGIREDKKAKDVVMEKPKSTRKVISKTSKASKLVRPAEKRDEKTLLNPTEETQVKKIKGHELKFTNLSKVFWPKEKITKRDMLNYYYQVAPFILPYLKDRPQSLNRHPNGINGESFYQKDVTGKVPEWIKTHLYHSEGDRRNKHFMVATDEASLMYMASLGCIEMNPWSSKTKTPDKPDWCIIDLDPAKNNFDQVIEVALVTKDVLDSLGIPGYAKTSGSTGIHIYIPLGAKYSYDQSKEFARAIATLVQKELPAITSIERTVKSRQGKIYIDFLQNRSQATVSAPYSLRPKPGATVSMPLHWDEVKKGLKMTDFHIFNAMDRLKSEGDIFKPVLMRGVRSLKIH